MSILASLVNAYDRLPNAPPFGYSSEKVGFIIGLSSDGAIASLSDMRDGEGKKKQPRLMLVPQPVKRTAGIAPNFLWDKTSYVLGVTAAEGKRTADEHAAFVTRHLEALDGSDDEGLKALSLFLQQWRPEAFAEHGWPNDMKDQNVVFALESERRTMLIHERQAAKLLWQRQSVARDKASAICLVTGNDAPAARLHPSIKGVWGAQSSGAALVSFNLDAFTSYGHEQGDNAPVSEAAAFAYTTALNRFLEKGSGHRIQIGDASTVFWADSTNREAAELAESFFPVMFDTVADDREATKEIGIKLTQIREGKQLADIEPDLAKGVRFYVLGLAPNAARLSIRFYFEDDFGVLTENYQAYVKDMKFEPWPANRPLPAIKNFVLRTAPARRDANNQIKFDTDRISPLLSGELFRSILTGNRFPGALLSHLIMRIRTDHLLDSIRIALIKGIIVRTMRLENRLPEPIDGTPKEEYLVRSDPNDPNPARRLGRLFAVLERAQLAALGDDINATVKDKFIGAAAATPLRVFANLILHSNHHTKRLRNGHSDAAWLKDKGTKAIRAVGYSLERDIGQLWGGLENGVPAQHSSEEQGLFLVGYYQERFGGKADPEVDIPEVDPIISSDGEE